LCDRLLRRLLGALLLPKIRTVASVIRVKKRCATECRA